MSGEMPRCCCSTWLCDARHLSPAVCDMPTLFLYGLELAFEVLLVSHSLGEVAIVDARSGATLGRLKQVIQQRDMVCSWVLAYARVGALTLKFVTTSSFPTAFKILHSLPVELYFHSGCLNFSGRLDWSFDIVIMRACVACFVTLAQDHTLALYETGPFSVGSASAGQVEDMLRLRHSFSYPANPEVPFFVSALDTRFGFYFQ
jgi:hypothetical protein